MSKDDDSTIIDGLSMAITKHKESTHSSGCSSAATTKDDGAPTTDKMIEMWAERWDLQWNMTELRCCFEDARSIKLRQ